jgi:hypothetical protein
MSWRCVSVAAIAVVVGCGGGGGAASTESPEAEEQGTGGETVSAPSTLSGTVGGSPWEARTAVAGNSVTGEADRVIALFPFVISCADLADGNWPAEASSGTRDVSVTVTWADGFTTSAPEGTFERSRSASADGGSVTVLRAGERGRLRLEMRGDDAEFDSISGEIDVIDCGPGASVRAPERERDVRLALAR